MSGLILTFVFDRNKRSDRNKEGSVELRMTLYKKQRYIGTGVRVLPKHWKSGQVVGLEDAEELNQSLSRLRRKVWKIAGELEERNALDLDVILARLNEVRQPKLTFIDYAEERAKAHSIGKHAMTQLRYDLFIKWLKGYGKIVFFEDITEKSIRTMDEDLKKKKMKDCSRYSNYHKFMKTFIIDAVNEGLVKQNPYSKLKISRGDTNGILRHLTPKEFHRLEDIEPPTKSLEQVRDLFVFQTYTMLSYCDLEDFDYKKCVSIGGVKVYTGRRHKTGQEFTFLLLDKAMAVLKKYDYRLPILSNVKYNLYLKALAQFAGIDKPLTTHYARYPNLSNIQTFFFYKAKSVIFDN